jgi:hypothetical protein
MTGSVETSQSVANSSAWVDLATVGPSVTINFASSNSSALVICAAQAYKSTANATGMIGFAVSGSISQAASAIARYDNNSTGIGWYALFGTRLVTGLSAGNNTFTMKYWSNGNTWSMSKRRIIVIPL